MVWRAAERFLEDGRSDLQDQHWDRRSGGWPDVAEPRKWCSRGECGVRGESYRLHLSELLYHLRWGDEKSPDLSSRRMKRSVGSVGLFVVPAEFLNEDGLECHTRLFHKNAKKCFAIFQAAEVARMPDEEVSCLPKSLEVVVR